MMLRAFPRPKEIMQHGCITSEIISRDRQMINVVCIGGAVPIPLNLPGFHNFSTNSETPPEPPCMTQTSASHCTHVNRETILSLTNEGESVVKTF